MNMVGKGNRVTVGLLCFILSCVAVMKYYGFPCCDTGAGFCADAQHMYARAIETELVTDWHSAFCMYEAIFLKKIVSCLLGYTPGPFLVMGVLFYAAYICFIVSLCIWMYIASKKGMRIILPWCLSLISFASLYRYCRFSLDSAFVGCVSVAISLVALYCFFALERKHRFFLLILILVSFVHIVALRRNAVFVLPVLVSPLIVYHDALLRRPIYKAGVVGLVMLSSYFFATSFVSVVLPVKTSHPVCVMMASDMRMVAIMNGEVESTDNEYVKASKNQHTLIQDSECGGGMILLYQWYTQPGAFAVDQTERWENLKRTYIGEWLKRPKDYIVARVISLSQFIYGGQTPPIVKKCVERLYPVVKGKKDTWEYRIGRQWVSPYKAVFHMGLILCSAVVMLWHVFNRHFPKTHNALSVYIALTGGVSVFYLLSFFVVTPSPDHRYVVPSVTFAYISIAFFGAYLCSKLSQKGNRCFFEGREAA